MYTPIRITAALALIAGLVFAASPAFAMSILVQTPSGSTLTLDLEPSDTIEGLRSRIQDVSGYPPEDQTLTYGGQVLEDGHNLSDYGIGAGASITLTLPSEPTDGSSPSGAPVEPSLVDTGFSSAPLVVGGAVALVLGASATAVGAVLRKRSGRR